MYLPTLIGLLVLLAGVRVAYDRRRVEALPRQSAYNETTQAYEASSKWYKGGMRFVERGRDNQGERMAFTEIVPPNTPLGFQQGKPGSSPYHVHTRQLETVEVLEGILTYRLNGTSGTLSRGETLVVPAGIDHQVWNSDPDVALKFKATLSPALSSEVFFENLFGIARDYDTHGTHATPLQMIALMYGHDMEISTDVAPPVRLAIKYILAPIAQLVGYRSMYPEYTSAEALESLKYDSTRRAAMPVPNN